MSFWQSIKYQVIIKIMVVAVICYVTAIVSFSLNIGEYITIKYNGIGIGPEHLTKVFDMFYRATENGAGSGLGLYIVKETISKLGGRIQLSSIPGEGTTIEIQIPALENPATDRSILLHD